LPDFAIEHLMFFIKYVRNDVYSSLANICPLVLCVKLKHAKQIHIKETCKNYNDESNHSIPWPIDYSIVEIVVGQGKVQNIFQIWTNRKHCPCANSFKLGILGTMVDVWICEIGLM
jgi:hypothetical protein